MFNRNKIKRLQSELDAKENEIHDLRNSVNYLLSNSPSESCKEELVRQNQLNYERNKTIVAQKEQIDILKAGLDVASLTLNTQQIRIKELIDKIK